MKDKVLRISKDLWDEELRLWSKCSTNIKERAQGRAQDEVEEDLEVLEICLAEDRAKVQRIRMVNRIKATGKGRPYADRCREHKEEER